MWRCLANIYAYVTKTIRILKRNLLPLDLQKIIQGLLSLTAQRAAFFLLGVGAFRTKFYRNRVLSCQNVDTILYSVVD